MVYNGSAPASMIGDAQLESIMVLYTCCSVNIVLRTRRRCCKEFEDSLVVFLDRL